MLIEERSAFANAPTPRQPGGSPREIPPRSRFQLIRFKDIKLSTTATYLVKGLIPREGLIVIWGPPKCGKTFWGFDVGMHIALGWQYRGRRVQQGAVVYVACEGERGLTARAEAFRQSKMAEDDTADPPFHLLTTRLDLAGDVDALIADINAQLDDGGCVAIFIDTLNRSLAGSESDDRDMGAYIKAADKLRETFHCAVIIIHHCGIVGTRPRGHTSLTGAVDAQIAVNRDEAGQVLTVLEFMKDGPEGEQTVSRLVVVDIGDDEDGEPINSCVIEPVEGAISASNSKEKRLSASQRRALELLGEAIIKAGQIPPACDHIPPNTRCVSEALWRGYCYAGQISDSDKAESKQKAFKRAGTDLLAAGRIGKWNDWVWIVP